MSPRISTTWENNSKNWEIAVKWGKRGSKSKEGVDVERKFKVGGILRYEILLEEEFLVYKKPTNSSSGEILSNQNF